MATAAGAGGIGVVRVSGPRALDIGQAVTRRRLQPRRAHYVRFRDGAGEVLDAGIALAFPAPASFTGEDVVELQGHGGTTVLGLVLDAVLAHGARMARPGEFTERAFLNGKLDLVQAEAVADLVSSATAAAARGAVRSLEGAFSKAVDGLDQAVLELRVFVEAAMDFPEEGHDFLAEGRVVDRLDEIATRFDRLLADTRQGVLLRDGIAMALVGAPNVGKSSLLNRLAGSERAIVTEVPGTTRDLIEADLSIDGLAVRVVDTAGLRESADPVEREGVRRARERASQADLVLMVEDDREACGATHQQAAALFDATPDSARVIHVRNKVDLSGAAPGRCGGTGTGIVRVSALTGAGITDLVALVKERVGFAGEGTAYTARRRHIEALNTGRDALCRARELLDGAAPAELIAEELRAVHLALGSIVGTVTADELLGEIFAGFCIGK